MILVTGGAGFIGSNLHAALCAAGREVVVADWLGDDSAGNPGKWRNLRHHIPLQIINPDEIEDFLARHPPLETIVHLGAISETTATDGDLVWARNVTLSQTLWSWCANRGVRFIYASSAATYGDGARGYSDADDVTPALRPLNMYGYSKHLFDLWAAREGLLDRIVGLKFFNVYGPNEDHKGEMRSVVAKAYEQIVSDGSIRLFESYRPGTAHGEQTRDFLYVKDAAAIALHLAATPTAAGLYNVGAGIARTWNDLACAIFAALGRVPRIVYIPMPETLRGRYQYRTEATIDRLRASGYDAAFTSLEDAVRDYICGYLIPGVPLGAEVTAVSARSTAATT